MGLAISKGLLEAMGGDIRVESRLGTGSTFEFRLPYVAYDETLARQAGRRSNACASTVAMPTVWC